MDPKTWIVIGPSFDRQHDQHKTNLSWLDQSPWNQYPQVAVDGGIYFATKAKIWLGDGDSSESKSGTNFLRKPDQNQTDFEWALNVLEEMNWQQIYLLGFRGNRWDHELAVIGAAYQRVLARPERRVTWIDSDSTVISELVGSGSHEWVWQGTFSVLSFEDTPITISGDCEYPIHHQNLGRWTGRGVSNKSAGKFQIDCMRPVWVHLVKDRDHR